jgi:hypothetical protein
VILDLRFWILDWDSLPLDAPTGLWRDRLVYRASNPVDSFQLRIEKVISTLLASPAARDKPNATQQSRVTLKGGLSVEMS